MFWICTSLVVTFLAVLYLRSKPVSISSIPNATPTWPILGNSIFFGKDPVKYLQSQRDIHGNVFLVDLFVLRMVFVLGPEANNTVFKGTEKSGMSLYAAAGEFFSETTKYCEHTICLLIDDSFKDTGLVRDRHSSFPQSPFRSKESPWLE